MKLIKLFKNSNFSISIEKTSIIYLMPYIYDYNYSNVKKEYGNKWDKTKHCKWYANIIIDWLGFEIEFKYKL